MIDEEALKGEHHKKLNFVKIELDISPIYHNLPDMPFAQLLTKNPI